MGATPLPGKIVAGHTGFAWAMRRSAFDSMSGLHEFSIVGGGDMDLVCALFGCPEKIRIDKSPKQWDMYLQWAMKVFSQKLSVNRLQIPIRHFWHGDESNRQYETRAQILVSQDYDPVQDVTHTSQGSIELSVKGARLQATIFQYFAARKTYL